MWYFKPRSCVKGATHDAFLNVDIDVDVDMTSEKTLKLAPPRSASSPRRKKAKCASPTSSCAEVVAFTTLEAGTEPVVSSTVSLSPHPSRAIFPFFASAIALSVTAFSHYSPFSVFFCFVLFLLLFSLFFLCFVTEKTCNTSSTYFFY